MKSEIMPVSVMENEMSVRLSVVLIKAAGAIGWVNPAGDSVSASVTLKLSFQCWVFV